MGERDEKKLIEWKNECFIKIQDIKQNPDSKNHEAFYRKIVDIIEEQKTSLSQNKNLQELFYCFQLNLYKLIRDIKGINFQILTLKLITLTIKVVNEEKIKKSLQIINARSTAFTVVQDLILDLIAQLKIKYNIFLCYLQLFFSDKTQKAILKNYQEC